MAQPIGSYGDSNSRSGFFDGGRDSSKGAKPGYGSTRSSFVDRRAQKAHADWVDNKYEQGRATKAQAASASKARLQPPTGPSMHPVVEQNKRQFGRPSQVFKARVAQLRPGFKLTNMLKKR